MCAQSTKYLKIKFSKENQMPSTSEFSLKYLCSYVIPDIDHLSFVHSSISYCFVRFLK